MTGLSDLHQDVGRLQGQLKSLIEEVDKLSTQVSRLNAVLHQGKGVQMALLLIPGVVGLIMGVLGYFGVKFTVGH